MFPFSALSLVVCKKSPHCQSRASCPKTFVNVCLFVCFYFIDNNECFLSVRFHSCVKSPRAVKGLLPKNVRQCLFVCFCFIPPTMNVSFSALSLVCEKSPHCQGPPAPKRSSMFVCLFCFIPPTMNVSFSALSLVCEKSPHCQGPPSPKRSSMFVCFLFPLVFVTMSGLTSTHSCFLQPVPSVSALLTVFLWCQVPQVGLHGRLLVFFWDKINNLIYFPIYFPVY